MTKNPPIGPDFDAKSRPNIGARVAILATAGIPEVVGRTGIVRWRHEDGIAFCVEIDGGWTHRLICDPTDVELLRQEAPANG